MLAQVRTPVAHRQRRTRHRQRAGAPGCALRAALPGAEHVLIPQAAHLPNLDTPHAYNQLIIRVRTPAPAGGRVTSNEGNAMTKILVLYYSSYGHVEQMAYAQAEGRGACRAPR